MTRIREYLVRRSLKSSQNRAAFHDAAETVRDSGYPESVSGSIDSDASGSVAEVEVQQAAELAGLLDLARSSRVDAAWSNN